LLVDDLGEVHLVALEGLGSSYRMKGFFTIHWKGVELKVNYEGVAFGGNYGGHNVSVNINDPEKKMLREKFATRDTELEELLSEVQRRLLNNEMIVEYESIKPQEQGDGLGI
jgi:hypothetical protein